MDTNNLPKCRHCEKAIGCIYDDVAENYICSSCLLSNNRSLVSALDRTLQALKIRNRGDPYACLEEVILEAEIALKG
jgi:hypothetical protein